MSAKRKKPRSVAKNLLLVFSVVFALLALVLYARSRNREVELILPEAHAARAALRTSTENGWGLLLAAAQLLPARPNAVEAPGSDQGRRPWEEPGTLPITGPSIAVLCGIDLPDTDPQVIAYAKGTAPAAAKAREALDQPHLISPRARRFRDNDGEAEILSLCRAMVALGRVNFDENPTAESLAPMVDAVKIVRAICVHEPLQSWAQVVEGGALQQFRALVLRAEGRSVVGPILEQLGPGYLPRRDVLRNVFLHYDDQLMRKESVLDMGRGSRMFRGAFLYELQQFVRKVKPRLEEVYPIADQRPPDLADWLAKNTRLERGPDEDPGGIRRRVALTVRRAAELSSEFEATRITLALEAFKADTGAYPATLDLLTPKYLPSVPTDTFSNAPFGYKVVDADYALYSVGPDLTDDAGNAEKDRVFHAPPAPPAPAA